MASNDPWADFEMLRHSVKHNTVDRLKQILAGLNDECSTHFSKSGKKQDIIDRITYAIDSWKQTNAVDKWVKAKTVLHQVRNTGTYTQPRATTTNGLHSSSSSMMSNNSYASSSSVVKTPSHRTPGTSLSANNFNGVYSSRELPHLGASGSSSAPRASGSSKPELRFKESPFFRVDEAVSTVVECPESQSAADRKQAIVSFTLTQDQVRKLKDQGSKYCLRLFCTSSVFYSQNPTFRTFPQPCPIEFPPTCEVRVNNVQLTASLKGLKKKPGTAPPPELDKFVRISTTQNRLEMVYVNSQQPAQPKKFYLVVKLVESSSVPALVAGLQQNNLKTGDEIRNQMKLTNSEDDDIVAGPQKLSLKCPLTLMRINTPCRSSKCVHLQCFDATSWFSVNEQTTTWLCPVCERTLEVKDLIIDGFTEGILKDCPDSVDDVMVEADGEWHTSDNKFGSLHWKMKHPPSSASTSSRKPVSTAKAPTPTNPVPVNGVSGASGGKPKSSVEIMVLDSDDEDEGRVKRELSPSNGISSGLQSQTFTSTASLGDVIDLTIDSDDDEPPPRNMGKRKATEPLSPTQRIWKKGRADDSSSGGPGAVPSRDNDWYASPAQSSRPVAEPVRVAYNSPTHPRPYTTFTGRTASSSVPQLPPINGYSSSRGNGSSSSRQWA